MRCHDVKLMLDAYLAGDLSPEANGSVEEHLSRCGACGEKAEVGARTAEMLGKLPPVRASSGFAEGVMKALRQEAARRYHTGHLEVRYFTVETSLGEAHVAHTREGVVCLALDASEEVVLEQLGRRFGVTPRHEEPSRRLLQAVTEAVESPNPRLLPRVSLARLPRFQRLVLEKVRELGPGVVRPYWWVAREIGHPGAARAVGTALARNPVPVLVPCHRVVRANGTPGGYALGGDRKVRLLEKEGLALADVAHSVTVYYGCRTTGIFCFPTCPHARRLRPENMVPFRSRGAAWGAGYRPCLVCRPG